MCGNECLQRACSFWVVKMPWSPTMSKTNENIQKNGNLALSDHSLGIRAIAKSLIIDKEYVPKFSVRLSKYLQKDLFKNFS